MTPNQLSHTAAVLADMLTFKQPADAVLSAYFRAHSKLGRGDRHEIAETAFAALRHYQKISAALRRPHAQPEKAALAALVGPVFDRIAATMVDAFVKRAEQVYG